MEYITANLVSFTITSKNQTTPSLEKNNPINNLDIYCFEQIETRTNQKHQQEHSYSNLPDVRRSTHKKETCVEACIVYKLKITISWLITACNELHINWQIHASTVHVIIWSVNGITELCSNQFIINWI